LPRRGLHTIFETLEKSTVIARETKLDLSRGNVGKAAEGIMKLVKHLEPLKNVQDEYLSQEAIVRVLASVGTQMSGFIHEVRGLLGIAESADLTLKRLRSSIGLNRETRSELVKLHGIVIDLRRSLERHASYLTEVLSPDARRRRSRQPISKRFDVGYQLVASIAEKKQLTVKNSIPLELKTPPMFSSELTAIFSNLLTNAAKAAGKNGRILASGRVLAGGSVKLRIENTGVRVNLRKSEKFFLPFESTTTVIDPVLGIGMGMGLPITRAMLEEYGAEIVFVEPRRGYATAIEITFPPK